MAAPEGLARRRRGYTACFALGLTLIVLATWCATVAAETPTGPSMPAQGWLSGGGSTQPLSQAPSSIAVSPALPRPKIPEFNAGRALANQPWIKAPTTTTARDGLGPLYNVRSCLRCHINGGRGHIASEGQLVGSAVVRLARQSGERTPHESVVPDPAYGDQIQIQSISLADQLGLSPEAVGPGADAEPPAEAKVYVTWTRESFAYPDGRTVELRKPTIELRELGYGPLAADTLTALRNAPVVHGVGLVALVREESLDAWADPMDKNEDGISGRRNQVWDPESSTLVPGRFGWKANSANLRHTVAGAFVNDLGITNPLFPRETCTAQQARCIRAPSGPDEEGVELPESLLQLVVDFLANSAVPAARMLEEAAHNEGSELFVATGCAQCHRPNMTTGASTEYPHLAHQEIWPFSDYLLHDMGEALADHRADFDATGREWRTSPLWGIGASKLINGSAHFLHDGRAGSVEEAILWHGGEAQNSRDRFVGLNVQKRTALIAFIESL
ncbi:MAG: di-heme oxidoredictase family protein [Pseudomonadota bacterium]